MWEHVVLFKVGAPLVLGQIRELAQGLWWKAIDVRLVLAHMLGSNVRKNTPPAAIYNTQTKESVNPLGPVSRQREDSELWERGAGMPT